MPLDTSVMNVVSTPLGTRSNYPRLDKRTWHDKCLSLREVKDNKREADRVARELDKMKRTQQAELVAAMDGSPVAQCGSLMLILKQGAAQMETLTLIDGRKIDFRTGVKSVTLADGTQLGTEQIAALFGGRAGSLDLDIAG